MTFDTIKLDKGLYTTGKGFAASLEDLDPSENYKGTPLEGLDAFQRQLKRFDIKVSGRDSDTISKFFQTSDSAVLFPEYVARAVKQGVEDADLLSKIVATTTVIDSMDYRSIATDFSEEDTALMDVAEGAFIPETTIKTKDKLTPLKKHGRMLVASYEAIKFQRLDLFTLMLKKIGEAISHNQFNDAMQVLFAENCEQINRVTAGSLCYQDLVNLWLALSPYRMTTVLAGTETVSDILSMSEFRDAHAGMQFHATGNPVTPLGAEIHVAKMMNGTGFVMALDNRYALEKIQAGDVVTEFDKLIDRQLERATVSAITGFSAIFTDAVKILA